MRYLTSFVLAQAIRPVDEQTITVVHTSTHILQGMNNQTGRLVYSCMPGSTVQIAKKGDNRIFSSLISWAREIKSPCSLPLLTAQSSLQAIPYLWPRRVFSSSLLNGFEKADF